MRGQGSEIEKAHRTRNAETLQLHSPYGWNAEGEIRTPEGLAAHQISSLARWTGLRYLSPVAIVGRRKYL